MEREHYRRNVSTRDYRAQGTGSTGTKRRTRYGNEAQKGDLREKIIIQLLISSVIFGLIMVLALIKVSPIIELRDRIKLALNESMTIEMIKEQGSKAISGIASLKDSALTTFGGTKEEGEEDLAEDFITQEVNTSLTQSIDQASQPLQPTIQPTQEPVEATETVRIDEDILEEIINRESFYGK